jgi:hypothetical protein
MNRLLVLFFFVLLVTVGQASAHPRNPQQPITFPQGPTAIPLDVAGQMNRQEQRLDQIDTRLVVIEKSVSRMEEDVRQLVKTDNVIDFIIGMMKLFIPGTFLTIFGIWLNRKWKEAKPSSPVGP